MPITEHPPQSGRIEARAGLRMMPTSPRPPLSFPTWFSEGRRAQHPRDPLGLLCKCGEIALEYPAPCVGKWIIPSWGLISTRGHAPPGIMTPTDISVVGPMARHADDLDMALRALAGPDLLQRTAWRVELPPPRRRRLGEFRVAVWPSSPLCRIDTSVSDLFDRAINAIVRAGATADDAAGPEIADERTSPSIHAAAARGDSLTHARRRFRSAAEDRRAALALPRHGAAMSRRAPPRRGR
jgi:hypothetical protein